MSKSVETMTTEREELATRLNAVRNEESDLLARLSRLDAQIFERNMDQSDEWAIVEDWRSLVPGEDAAVAIIRPAGDHSFATIGKVFQLSDSPGRTVSDGGSNFLAVTVQGEQASPEEGIRAKVWHKVPQ